MKDKLMKAAIVGLAASNILLTVMWAAYGLKDEPEKNNQTYPDYEV